MLSRKNSKVIKLSLFAVSACVLSLGGASVANAGFQWVAPANSSTTQAQQPQAMPSVPAAPVTRMPAPQPQMAPQPAPMAPAPSVAPPNIVLAPMGQSAQAPAPSVATPNIVLNDTPAMMPGSSAVPQSSRVSGPVAQNVAQPMISQSAPRPVASSISVAGNGVNPQQPRRARPDFAPQMAPQPILPNAAPMAAPIASAPTPVMSTRGRPVDFVPAPATASQAAVAPMPSRTMQMQPIMGAGDPVDSAPTSWSPSPQAMPSPMMASPNVSFSSAPANGGMVTSGRASSMGFENAVGFGKDLPLMTAVKQIVPQDYGISFVAGVPDDVNVSWQGGRPWNEALDIALAPQGLQSSIQGDVVTIMPMAPAMPNPSSPVAMYEETSMALPSGQIFNNSPAIGEGFQGSGALPVPASSAPSSLLQNTASMGSVSSRPTTQPMIGATAPQAGVFPPAQQMNPQLYDNSIQFWAAPKDSSLREVLTSWTRKAGVELFWASEYDYPIASAINIEGNFEEAIQKVLSGLAESNPRPQGRLHPNLPNGPAVLVIEARGEID